MSAIGLARHRVDELMDSPAIAPDEHRRALEGLVKVNRASLTPRILWPHIHHVARASRSDRLSLLDVACGGGDVPLAIHRLAAREGITLELTLADRSELALSHARNAAGDIPVRTVQCLATDEALPECDVVINSLFLHHLDEPEVVHTLTHLASRAKHLLLISDLIRSPAGLAIAWTACRIFSSSPVMHHDGPASVRAAWTPAEMRRMCQSAGLVSARITPSWPWRMLIRWGRTG